MRALPILIFSLALRVEASEVLDNASIVRMVAAGLGTDVIVLKIERSQGAFDTSTDGLIALKSAHVPDPVLRAMLLKGDTVVKPPEPQPATAPVVVPVPSPRAGDDVCANVKFYTTSNDGPAWVRSSVCIGATSVSVDEQTIALADIVVQCTSKAPVLSMGSSLLHGDQEWWIGDKQEALKFRGKPEDLDRLATALTHARNEIPHGSCSDSEVRRKLVRP